MSKTIRDSGAISAAVLASRILGLVREALFAALFGAGALADAYQVAFRIPNLLRDLFAEGALSSAFVPTFARTREKEGEAAAWHLANLVLGGVFLVTGGLAVLGAFYAPEIVDAISAGFRGDGGKAALAVRLTRILMPLLCLVSIAAVWMGVANARGRFLAPALAPAAFNVVLIAGGAFLLVWNGTSVHGLLLWSGLTVAAGAVQAAVQLPALLGLGYRPVPAFLGLWRHPGVRRIVRLMGPAVVGLAAVQINVFVNTRFASQLGNGPVAQLSYAFRLFYLPIGMFGVALATVTTTNVAKEAARSDMDALRARTAEGLSAAWMLTAGSAVGLMVLAEPIVAVIFERGRFGPEATAATARVLQAYAVGLLPYSLVKILAPAFYAVDRPRVPLAASVLAVCVNVSFNAASYRALGAPGIALGTALGAFCNTGVLYVMFRRILGPVRTFASPGHAGALVLGLALLGAACTGGAWVVDAVHGSAAASLGTPVARFVRALLLLGVIALAGVSYLGLLARFAYPGADLVLGLPGRLRKRGLRARRVDP